MNETYPRLFNFFRSFFSKNWRLYHSDPSDCIHSHIINNTKKDIDEICIEIKNLMNKKLSDEELNKIIISDFGCHYDCTLDGYKPKKWLKEVLDQLERERHLAHEIIISRIYPNLFQFLGCQFNQDWGLDFSNANEVINNYVINETKSEIDKICSEIKELMDKEYSDEELRKIIIYDLGCYYDFRVDGYTSKEWLQRVLDQLEREKHLAIEG